MDGIRLLHRFGGHGGRPTEWEIRAVRHTDPDVAKSIRRLPTDFQTITHSGQHHDEWATDWLNLPQGVSPEDAGAVAALLATRLYEDGVFDKLVALLRRIDVETAKEDALTKMLCEHDEWPETCVLCIPEPRPELPLGRIVKE